MLRIQAGLGSQFGSKEACGSECSGNCPVGSAHDCAAIPGRGSAAASPPCCAEAGLPRAEADLAAAQAVLLAAGGGGHQPGGHRSPEAV